MIKKILLFVIVLFSLIMLGCAFGSIINLSSNDIDDEVNIIQNSSFEQADLEVTEYPDNWFVLSLKDEIIRLDSEESRSGENSILIDNPIDKITLVSDAFEIDPSCVYYSRCFIKSEQLTEKPLRLYLIAFNARGERVNTYKNELHPSREWEKIEFTSGFFNSSAKIGRIAIYIPDQEDNSYWIDDAESYKMHRFAFSQE